VEGRKAGCTARAPHGIDATTITPSVPNQAATSHATTSPSRPEGNRGPPKPIRDTGDNPRPIDLDRGGGGGGATLSEMYQSARRLLLSARVERLASAPASSSYSASARPTRRAPRPCAGRWRRSRASARRWTASGAPSPPRASATSGRGEDTLPLLLLTALTPFSCSVTSSFCMPRESATRRGEISKRR
jgi:hypothetical protein